MKFLNNIFTKKVILTTKTPERIAVSKEIIINKYMKSIIRI